MRRFRDMFTNGFLLLVKKNRWKVFSICLSIILLPSLLLASPDNTYTNAAQLGQNARAVLGNILYAPIQAVVFVKNTLDQQSSIIAGHSSALFNTPAQIVSRLGANLSFAPNYFTGDIFSWLKNLFPWWQSPTPPAAPSPIIPSPYVKIYQTPQAAAPESPNKPQAKLPLANKPASTGPITTREIIREKEIITQRVIQEINPYNFSSDPLFLSQLDGLRQELTNSFSSRLNSLVGNLGFTSNRFDTLYVNNGIKTGSNSSVQLIDASGRIPELSSTYFSSVPGIFSRIGNASLNAQFSATSTSDLLSFAGSGGTTVSFNAANKLVTITSGTGQNIFASIGNASSTVQFSAGSTADVLAFEGTGGTSLTFDSVNKKIQISSIASGTVAPLDATYLTLSNNASLTGERALTAGSNITFADGGANSTLTVNVASSPVFSGTLTVQGTATSTIGGPLVIGSGNVTIANATGKIPGITSVVFQDLSGINLTNLNASSINNGTLGVAYGGTGQTLYTDGQLLIGNSATGSLTKTTLTAGSNIIITNGNGSISIAASGTGISGPSSSTVNAIAVYGNTSGNSLLNTGVLIDSSANITGVRTLNSATSLTTPLITTPSGNLVLAPVGNTIIKGSTTDSSAGALNVQNSASTTLFLVRNDGNVGIGTSSPSGLLHVTASTTNTLYLANQTGSGLLADLQQNGSSRFSVSTAGNVTITGRLITGSGAVNLTNDAGKIPALSSTYLADLSGANLTGLNATNVTTGTLGVAQGGTGQTSYTDGQLLIGNSSTGLLSKSTLTAGSNIVITNSNGAITIATNASSTGDVGGPASSTATAIATFSGTTGKAIQNTAVLIDSSANITGIRSTAIATSESVPLITTPYGNLTLAPVGNTIIKGSTTDSSAGALNVQNSASTTLFFVRNDGNVGIGTTSPSALLHVTASSTNTIYLANQTGSGLIADFQQNGGTRFSVNTNGNVTILGKLITGSGAVSLTNDGGEIPNISSTYFADISGANLTGLNASNISSGTLGVAQGGTGVTSATAYALLAGGTTSTGAFQSVSGLGTSGQVLTSNGAGALPTWQASGGGTITSITGTAGQVIVNPTTGAVVLSLPQSIQTTSTPQFLRLGLGQAADANTVLTATASSTSTLIVGNQTGSGLIADFQQNGGTRFSVNTNGNVTIKGKLTTGSSSVALTNDAGNLNASNITFGTLAATVGGTGLTAYTTGDLLYASSASALSKLGIGGANSILTSSGSAPQWSTSLTLAGNLAVNGSATSTFTGPVLVGNLIGTSSGNLTLAPASNTIINGNVGIGTSSPLALLHLNASTTKTLLVNNLSGSGDLVDIQQGGSTKFYITNAGNVGIGTSSPNAALHVAGSTIIFGSGENGTPSAVTIRGAAASGSNITGADLTFDASNGTGSGGSGNIVFRTAPASSNNPPSFLSSNSANSGASSSSSFNFTHSCSGANRLLVVGVSTDMNGSGTLQVNSITFGSSNLTLLTTAQTSDTASRVELWYLVAPPTGTQTVTVNLSAATFSVAGAACFTGANQTSPFGTSTTNSTTGALSLSATVSGSSSTLIIDLISKNNIEAITAGGSQTSMWNTRTTNGSNANNTTGGSSYATGAASVAMSWSWSVSRHAAMLGVPINGAGATDASALTEVMRLTPSGLVGIGTSAPANLLSVNGSAAIGLGYATSTAPSDGLIVKGNTGIGTASPTALLHVSASSSNTMLLVNATGGSSALLDIQQGGNSKFYITNNGNVGIGTTTVFGNGQRLISLQDATTVPNVNPSGGGLLYSTSGALKWRGSSGTLTNIASADYSEYLPARLSVEHADIVVLSKEGNPRNDPSAPFLLEKSSSPYQHGIVGVVSSYVGDEKEYDFYQPVTLAGRVPVRVSLENGTIQSGDYLTSSSLPGVAMKATHAGQVIGMALGNYDGKDASSTTDILPGGKETRRGQVVILVQLGYQGNNLSLQQKDGKLTDEDVFLTDKDGNQLAFTQDGDIVVKHLVVKQFEMAKGGSLTLPKGENQTIGHATVLEGETRVDINNELVQKSSEIILTLKSTPPDGLNWAAGDTSEGKFVIKLSRKAPYNLEFAYLIINAYSTDTPTDTNTPNQISSTNSQDTTTGPHQVPDASKQDTTSILQALNLAPIHSNSSSTAP